MGIVSQSLCLSRVANPPPPLSQALNAADTLPQKGEQLQTFQAHWKDWKEVAGEALKNQFMRVAKICDAQQFAQMQTRTSRDVGMIQHDWNLWNK